MRGEEERAETETTLGGRQTANGEAENSKFKFIPPLPGLPLLLFILLHLIVRSMPSITITLCRARASMSDYIHFKIAILF